MNEISILIMILLTGLILGLIFYGGLWWTVQKIVSAKRPVLWIFGSLFLRTAIVLTGFYFAANGQWKRLLVCLFGFVISRILLLLQFRKPWNKAILIQEAIRES